ncbi:PAS domain S-box-containing protein [Maridesulfovibrio ferrireducens]|uniref:histidine kinase n=1 Tax=Maridesulfovibrio ferrireducens TaxID=246191 RepID=A0A1G9LIP0_9BACT|nr:transporter substrate-binding domain-containing protein [Maridesulfovibrio ferrireducens]SDL61800.1 PAS domain S-box-containing protein [Maridesulfovibrio ferrireducens]
MTSNFHVRDLFIIFTFLLCLFVFPAKVSAAHILVQGDYNYPPYEFLDNGIPSGFNVDIMRAVAAVMGLRIKIDLGPWNEVLSSLKRGEIDALTGMYYSPERAKFVDFSMPHNIVSHAIFVRQGSDIRSLDDLSGKEILVQRGDIMNDYVVKNYPDATIVPVRSQIEALKLLASGKHDVALLGKLQNIFWANKENITNIITVGPPIEPGDYCFAVHKGDKKLLGQLNEGLSLIKNSGKYDEIYNKWFGVYERKSVYREYAQYAIWILTPLLAFLAFFILWTWMLRLRVKEKTEELTLELFERHQAEEELRKVQSYLTNVINSMPSMLIGVDQMGIITQWNTEAERVTGLSPKEVVGRSLEIVIPYLGKEIELIRQTISTRQEHVTRKRNWKGSSEIHYEDVTIYPLLSNDVQGAVIIIDNVTERINMEQMLMQTEKMMSLGGLAAGMAHEINNPLAVILGSVQNIKRRIFTDVLQNEEAAKECEISLDNVRNYLKKREVPRMLDAIQDSSSRAAKIVSNMLSFSRKSDKSFKYHSITEIMDRTLDLISNDYDLVKEYDFRKIEIVRDYAPDLSDVFCEGNEIQQVFLNLFKNGTEAMAEKKYNGEYPRFTLKVQIVNSMVVVEIEDNGPGIDEEKCKRIFEPFFTSKGVGKGTGLGLSVSYFIVTDHHKGSMEVSSLPGSWTRFIVKLPVSGKIEERESVR